MALFKSMEFWSTHLVQRTMNALKEHKEAMMRYRCRVVSNDSAVKCLFNLGYSMYLTNTYNVPLSPISTCKQGIRLGKCGTFEHDMSVYQRVTLLSHMSFRHLRSLKEAQGIFGSLRHLPHTREILLFIVFMLSGDILLPSGTLSNIFHYI